MRKYRIYALRMISWCSAMVTYNLLPLSTMSSISFNIFLVSPQINPAKSEVFILFL